MPARSKLSEKTYRRTRHARFVSRIVVLASLLQHGFSHAGLAETRRQVTLLSPADVSAALQDMAQRWPERCASLADTAWTASLESDREGILKRLDAGDPAAVPEGDALVARVRGALLALPLLDADRLLAVRRKANNLALPTNWNNLFSTASVCAATMARPPRGPISLSGPTAPQDRPPPPTTRPPISRPLTWPCGLTCAGTPSKATCIC